MIKYPLISVVVPIYKVEEYLDRCVNSLVNQSYKNIEIVLVDDGSPDNCPRMCDDYAKRDSRIVSVHKPNGGLSDARNAGMAVASGELMMFIDSDDYIDADMIRDMYLRMTEDKSDIVSCAVKWVYDDSDTELKKVPDEHTTLNRLTAMRELLNDGLLKQHVWNKLYKTDMIKNIPFEKGKYHEDVFWSYQAIARAEKISVMQSEYYYYIQRSNSIMGEGYSSKRLDALDAMKQRCDFLKCEMPSLFGLSLKVYMESCMYHYQCAIKSDKTKRDTEVKKNILSRLSFRKTGNVFKNIKGIKQRIWMRLFFALPRTTCLIRNALKIGI